MVTQDEASFAQRDNLMFGGHMEAGGIRRSWTQGRTVYPLHEQHTLSLPQHSPPGQSQHSRSISRNRKMARAVRRAASNAVSSSERPGMAFRTPPWSVSPSPPIERRSATVTCGQGEKGEKMHWD
ncbi:hypothetical protein PoB_006290300 [Plakobranchus ocellatus]|uniref:Uncharacterized protein n=1 Tax=Plakobranchus ocellatus TaxID=259542 RepID=A0AAV4CX05_9GAST|nr:hypothetical protein PoB_006290300 [Plakobranchus ocellatus]